MKRLAVLNVVGLSQAVLGKYTPFLNEYIKRKGINKIDPVFPAVTTTTQSTYVTGTMPSEHGIVGNGWYDHRDSEIKFWKQSNKLVQKESLWTEAKRRNPEFTVAQLFWWYNMYNGVDFSVTPRPNYLADGRKIPDCYSHPASLRDELQEALGQFPLFNFWGPGADIVSTKWIAEAAKFVETKHQPTLNLVYLPHLDYCQQKFGPHPEVIGQELTEIDDLLKDLIGFFEEKGVEVLLLSEYGISPVNNPIHINRLLRNEGYLGIRVERGLELLDAGASEAFAVSDHQIAHIYTRSEATTAKIIELLQGVKGIAHILDKEQQKSFGINHKRSGDIVLMADQNSWFTYYFWLDDAVAPDYARMVDIHKKPGYDPVEVFMTSKTRAIYKVLLKKLGFRSVLDVIPLDASLVKGSHGSVEIEKDYFPIIIGNEIPGEGVLTPLSIKELILNKIFS
ncbi:MAG TPA: alkaline phosphatase family protein [Candidatus Sphingobacterium stercoripullorum]|uniref:Alkaline phosphatase family protein n=1 Tax=Candidatus Sphingobacterium stercoripullorum TaxID=2838759 RepID=A0A9D1WAC0_9SPHI|nr:alkaline phosphatase family protein [Candidatus Sphingobacterium stercoripullorum]